MAQITKREIFIDGVLSQTITSAPFDKIVLPPMSAGNHTVYSKVYVDGSLAFTEPVRNFKVEFPTPMEGVVSDYPLSETSGDAIDTIGGHNATLFGGITRNGESYVFDGSTGYMTIPDNDDHSFVDENGEDTPYTIRMVLKFNSLAGTQYIINKRDNTSSLQEWALLSHNGAIQMKQYTASSGKYIGKSFSNSQITVGQEYHFVIRYNGAKTSAGITFRLNKIKVTDPFVDESVSGTTGQMDYTGMEKTISKVVVGNAGIGGSRFANIEIEKLRIHKGYAWTDQELEKDYNELMGV